MPCSSAVVDGRHRDVNANEDVEYAEAKLKIEIKIN